MNPTSLDISVSPTTHTARPARAPGRHTGEPARAEAPRRGQDTVELSNAARRADESPVRLDLVQRVRDQIARGGYESLDKIVVAAEGLRRDVNVVA